MKTDYSKDDKKINDLLRDKDEIIKKLREEKEDLENEN